MAVWVTRVTYSDCLLSGQTWSPLESPKKPRGEQTPGRSWSYNDHPACEPEESENTNTDTNQPWIYKAHKT